MKKQDVNEQEKKTCSSPSWEIGDEFTIGYVSKKIMDIRTIRKGTKEYLLSDGRWYTELQMIFWPD